MAEAASATRPRGRWLALFLIVGDNSLDSRVPPDQGGVGYMPLENFIAQAAFVIFNTRHPERTLKSLH